jgi:hypothetical protein
MKIEKYKTIFYLVLFSLLSCASKHNIQTEFPEKIKATYFQQWIGGQELTGMGIYFYIQLEKPLSSNIQLEKVYFRGNEAVLNKENENSFKANFFQKKQNDKVSKAKENQYNLTENQALLTFKIDNKIFYYTLEHLEEKELIAYPSVGKPRK